MMRRPPWQGHTRRAMDILLIDDHTLLCEAFSLLFASRWPQARLHVAHRLDTGLQAGRALPRPLLVLLDLGLPDAQGLPVVQQARAALPDARIVVLSADDRPDTVADCLALGASGHVPKTADLVRLQQALGEALCGHLAPGPDATAAGAGAATLAAGVARGHGLTPRQCDVLQLLVDGHPNKAICRALRLSESAVKAHLEAVYRRLGVNNRTQAVVAAAGLGFTLPSPARSVVL